MAKKNSQNFKPSAYFSQTLFFDSRQTDFKVIIQGPIEFRCTDHLTLKHRLHRLCISSFSYQSLRSTS